MLLPCSCPAPAPLLLSFWHAPAPTPLSLLPYSACQASARPPIAPLLLFLPSSCPASAPSPTPALLLPRGVQRPVHPILSIGARGSGGPGRGPCIVTKFSRKNYKKKVERKRPGLIVCLGARRLMPTCSYPAPALPLPCSCPGLILPFLALV